MNELHIRAACAADADAISEVIVQALRQSNALDYPPSVIERVACNFTPAAIVQLLAIRLVLVAEIENAIVGTASLDGEVVRTVFVAPAVQGRGIGRALMCAIEQAALQAGVRRLSVPSSLTAQAFYVAQGYTLVREVVDNDERTLVMARDL
ncbi:GNAT family N-acetyltransferase [Pseudomonas sp. MM211]|uniref:GNAT family N-acetyltransferase n=1 Tax=Pseudomonas sp. MM211 TaxID=2866808 RepID=UPI001CEC71AE|nr:GNAT family N-acetyltransferase [Pseudomonas sp. MM211]UCJ17188.1 GNAT family N-acetyltransferase [Pseudomonas sp. MM211]